MNNLSGKVAVVTGGSRGIGRAVAHRLAAAGAEFVIASRKLDRCRSVAEDISSATGRRVLPLQVNVGQWDDCSNLVDSVYDSFGACHVLVSNAGMSPLYPDLVSVAESLYDMTHAANAKGPFRLATPFGSRMHSGKAGSIINISTAGSLRPHIIDLPSTRWRKQGSTHSPPVRQVHGRRKYAPIWYFLPGPFDTDVAKAWPPELKERIPQENPMQRIGHPEDLVGLCVFLASDASSYINGAQSSPTAVRSAVRDACYSRRTGKSIMKAARISAYGPIENLRVEQVDDPVPSPRQVVVDIAAAAVNYPDLLIMSGDYQVRWPLPLTPGSEFAGTVRSVGPDVTGIACGDRVAGSTPVGAFAERIAVAPEALWAVPPEADLAEAAAFRITYLTAYHALRSVAEVQPGDQVVVLGAAGGVGMAAVEIAALLGARVTAAVSSPEKATVCRTRGAHGTIDYGRENLKERIKELTGGADIVIDPVGGRYSEQALRACSWGARFVCLGFASSEIPAIPLNLVLLKGVHVCGMEVRTFAEHRPEAARRDEEELTEHFRTGRLRPYIGARYPLEKVADAMSAVRERRTIGKVLVMTDSYRPATSDKYRNE